jgi:hypothetical protein
LVPDAVVVLPLRSVPWRLNFVYPHFERQLIPTTLGDTTTVSNVSMAYPFRLVIRIQRHLGRTGCNYHLGGHGRIEPSCDNIADNIDSSGRYSLQPSARGSLPLCAVWARSVSSYGAVI